MTSVRRFLSSLLTSLAVGAVLCFGLSAAGAQAPATPAVAEYMLGTGDVLHIVVYQNPDLTLDARLSDSGFISFPLLGNVKLGGLTVGQAENALEQGLKSGGFVKNPQVTVVLTQVRGNQVSVLGQVNRPGRYALEQAQTRLSDVLALAGGVAPGIGSDVVTIVGMRAGKPSRVDVDFPSVFAAKDPTTDILLQNNDVVWVDRAPMIYIYGEVQRPGQIRLERGMTLLQGLAAGGGLTPRGTEKGLRVHRRNADGKVEIIQPSMDDLLQNGDVLYVRESLF